MHRRYGIDPAKIHLGSELVADLGLDELDRIELFMYLEQRYEAIFPDESLIRYESILELIIYVVLKKMEEAIPKSPFFMAV
jgi:acyl carrier protein